MSSSNDDRPEPQKYWESLSPEEKWHFRKLIGIGPRKTPTVEQIEVGRSFDATRKRIRQIEQRALRKLQGNNGK